MSLPKYRSYLLRMWHEGTPTLPGWRFTLTSLVDDEQRGCATLEKLVDLLKEEMAAILASELNINAESTKE